MNPSSKKKLDIYQEEAKARQTTHWDWDYLTEAQITACMEKQRRARVTRRRRFVLGAAIGVALTLGLALAVFQSLELW